MFYRLRISALLLFFSLYIHGNMQQPVEPDVWQKVKEIHAMKQSGLSNDGAGIIEQVIHGMGEGNYRKAHYYHYDEYSKTAVSILVDSDSIRKKIDKERTDNGYVFRKLIHPLESWLQYARSTGKGEEMELSMLLYEDNRTVFGGRRYEDTYSHLHASRYEGFFQLIGRQNTKDLLDLLFGNVDLTQPEGQMMLLSFRSPLAPDALSSYRYHLMGTETIDGIACYNIAFYSINSRMNTFSGYLYIRADGTDTLQKAVFTLNNPERMNFVRNLLVTQTFTVGQDEEGHTYTLPEWCEYQVMLGYPGKGVLSGNRLSVSSHFDFTPPQGKIPRSNTVAKDYAAKDSIYWESVRPVSLSASQTQVGGLLKEAWRTPVFVTAQTALLTLMNNHFTIGGVNGSVDLGPLTQFISYNHMEGMRFRIGGNTNTHLMNRWMLGGYLAYGTTDKKLKYRTDLAWSLAPKSENIWEFPKKLFGFTYVDDLNIPGQDLLTTTRDNVFNSFSHAPTDNMSRQKIGILTFEHESPGQFAYKVAGKYTSDQPMGVVQYLQVNGSDTTMVDKIVTSEMALSLSWNPGQRSIQNRDKRIYIRRGEVELTLNHRIGIKGLFGSDYNYQITDVSAFKKLTFARHAGSMNIRLAGGMVWNRVPFPLLFIPAGNQSYLFRPTGFNCMNFYEFVTDRYVSAHANCLFNWSPAKWFNKRDKTQVSVGARMIYGPLSDSNNPASHPELFVFNQGVKPLGDTPYVEVNIGLANLFKILRVEYSRRLTYLSDSSGSDGKGVFAGSLLVTGSFAF